MHTTSTSLFTAPRAVPTALSRFKWRRPLIQRIRRLHIVMSVTQASWLARRMQPVGINEPMASSLDQPDILHPNAFQLGHQRFRHAAHIVFMLRQRRYRWNPQQGLQLISRKRGYSPRANSTAVGIVTP